MTRVKQPVGPPRGALGSVEVTVLACRCRCGHEWLSREAERPRVCPKCKSAELGSTQAVRTNCEGINHEAPTRWSQVQNRQGKETA